MKRVFQLAVAFLAVPIATAGQAQAGIVFDNGSTSWFQPLRVNSGLYSMYEDFSVSAPTTITGFRWAQHDDNGTIYSSTDLTVVDGVPGSGAILFADSIVASRTVSTAPLAADVFGIKTDKYTGFDYEISGLALELAAGTYFFGVHNNVSGGGTHWNQVGPSGQTAQTMPGLYLQAATEFLLLDENGAFQVLAADAATVPEPASMAIFSMGAFGMAIAARRRRRERAA